MTTSRTIKKVVLFGDSTLDNYHWVRNDIKATVSRQLKLHLAEDDAVFNLAVDGFTTTDVLKGAKKNKAVTDTEHATNEIFHPFEALTALTKQEKPTHIILSVGGNDIRESITLLIFSEPAERKEKLETVLRLLQENYIKIIDQLQTTCPDANIVIMLQYTPSINPDMNFIYYLMQQMINGRAYESTFLETLDLQMHVIFGRSMKVEDAAVKELHELMAQAYAPVIAHAREKCIPIIDMATTFDHTLQELYVSQIEPSRRGASIIAEMITHTVNNHDFNGPSVLYVKPGCTSGPILSITGDHPWRPHAISKSDPNAIPYFRAEYMRRLKRDKSFFHGIFGTLFAISRVNQNAGVDELISHAKHGGKRSLQVISELGWLDDQPMQSPSPRK